MSLEDNLGFTKCLLELKKYHPNFLGFTDYLGTSTLDKTYPKQNNIHIVLLIKNCEKLENIEKTIAAISLEKEIDKFTDKFNKIPLERKNKIP
jgi:hypothetical protein